MNAKNMKQVKQMYYLQNTLYTQEIWCMMNLDLSI
jgi:hypothetical protein